MTQGLALYSVHGETTHEVGEPAGPTGGTEERTDGRETRTEIPNLENTPKTCGNPVS